MNATRSTAILLAAMLAATAGAFAALNSEGPIKPGDVVFIKVFRHPDMSTTTQVDDQGNVKLNYVGNVTIEGLTEEEASGRVSKAYQLILKNPRVTVSRSASGAGFGGGYMERTEEMDTQVVLLNNANADILTEALTGMSTAGGSISFDPETNAMILTDTPTTLQKMIGVVRELDEMQSRITQVHIEAKIAEVQNGAIKELGVRWFVQGDHTAGGYYPNFRQNSRVRSSRILNDPVYNEILDSGNARNGGGGREFIDENNWDRRLQIPVQVPSAGQMFLGYMNQGIDFGSLVDALVADNKAEMLAAPYIRTVNHRKATIRMTEKFPFQEVAQVGLSAAQNTEFVDVGIIMDVTPHVRRAPDGTTYVQLELMPEVSTITGVANGIPVRSVRTSETVANVLPGQTLVIGGIVQSDSQDVIQELPGLGKLPLLGALFRRKEKSTQNNELMIFVTPSVYERPGDVTWSRSLNLPELAPEGPAQALNTQLEVRKE